MIIAFLISILLFHTSELTSMEKIPINHKQPLRYLALGDSYTIGEGVDESERYPNQTVRLLQEQGIIFSPPTIIAKTGWTTDELAKGIEQAGIEGKTYDFVTLLIGVNNQYRRRNTDNYAEEFSALLSQAITFAGGNPKRVVVISIPDWGVTPFGLKSGRNLTENAQAIDQFNAVKKSVSESMDVFYIDITEDYRNIGAQETMVVEDLLHPSGLVYHRWALKIQEILLNEMDF
jgi:lysophospholipase L1-like esterase